ncbi:50s ribosome-binding gtpase [Holotrichia oblita]|uniref:50s ribosome-binding gtpase n=1 Tax=Holotrichia oblita TaxID=644536 RepID=A0ACB9T6S8_HOLOL|nr:50s ribosome-binding gtpase [Holotrichia oblita]
MDVKKKIVNVLVLGETGVGKSTFINSFLNHTTYSKLEEATKHKLLYFIPPKFTLLNDDFNKTEIKIGSSSNEIDTPGESSTQYPVSYLFDINNKDVILRIIDTPGIGDTRGLQYDERNTENLLTFIGELDYLNCICILLKPNNSRLNVLFDYCIKHILLRLDKKIRTNIVFLFTNARSSFYTPGDTFTPLKVMLDEIKRNQDDDKIPLDSPNVFCVDNESFRYLAAKSSGVQFSQNDMELYSSSWDRSSTTYKRFIDYVASLPDIPMKGIVSVNESRRIVGRLAKPAVELMILQEKSLITLENHKKKLDEVRDNMTDLRNILYTPVIQYAIGKKTTSSVTKHTMNAGLQFSFLPPFVTVKLGYKYSNDTKLEDYVTAVETLVEDPKIKSLLDDETKAREAVKQQLQAIAELAQAYKQEARTILSAAAIFTNFLKENAILFGTDPLELYLKSLLEE